jgi:hypothetical protein
MNFKGSTWARIIDVFINLGSENEMQLRCNFIEHLGLTYFILFYAISLYSTFILFTSKNYENTCNYTMSSCNSSCSYFTNLNMT